MKKTIISLFLFLILSFAFSEDRVQVQSAKIPFRGLTGTITDLLKARPKTRIQLGSYYLKPEDFMEQNIDEIFDCDEVGNAYLSSSDDVYYERFADVISEEISNGIQDKSATAHVLVDASAEGDIITISFAVNYTKNAILPLYFDTVNSDFKLSASINCVIEYQITFDIELDADRVNNDDMLNGTNITLYACSIEIKPIEDDSPTTARVVYNDTFYDIALGDEYINAAIYWRLPGDVVDDVVEPQKITYEQLKNGDYQWDVGYLSNLEFTGTSISDESEETETIEISVDFDNTTSVEFQKIHVTDRDGTKELLVKKLGL